MNQGKLDMVKQEMARVNINILGISELKWDGEQFRCFGGRNEAFVLPLKRKYSLPSSSL